MENIEQKNSREQKLPASESAVSGEQAPDQAAACGGGVSLEEVHASEQAEENDSAALEQLKSENEIKQMIYQSGARNPAFLESVIRDQVLRTNRFGPLAKDAVRETIETLRRTNGYLFADVRDHAVETQVYQRDPQGTVSGYATGLPFTAPAGEDLSRMSDAEYYQMLQRRRKAANR